MNEVTISIERYEQLIRAEQDANVLKSMIASKFDSFGIIDRDDLKILHSVYCGDCQ